ncbi:MAG: enoyl-CoA hydratase-related protein, partial [Myxococcota bacterium]
YDLRIAARDAKLGFVFVRRGVMPELSSTWILPRLIGVAKANELLLTGRIFLGEEAAELGVVNEAVDAREVLPRAMEIARDIATNAAPASVALTKRIIWRNLAEPDPSRAARNEGQAFAWLGKQADAKEGVVSFLEKREPNWKLSPSSAPDFDGA